MPSLASRVASDPPTFSPGLIRCTSDTISTVPLLILVGMAKACASAPRVEGSGVKSKDQGRTHSRSQTCNPSISQHGSWKLQSLCQPCNDVICGWSS